MTTDDLDYLLPSAYEAVAKWSFTTWPDRRCGQVPHGQRPTQGFYSAGRGGPYLFCAKRELHRGTYASFSTTLIGAAISATPPRKLVEFVGEPPYALGDATVFDARRVANQAERRTHVDSKRERDVPIFDVSAEAHGIPLGDHLSGRRTLPGPVADEVRESTLREFGVVRA